MSWLKTIREDVQCVMDRDPAATSWLTVLLCSPGVYAIWMHRFQHGLWTHGMKLPARFLSQVTRFFTGIEIHPGATLGRRLIIDHGMGVVIGETAEVGDDVTLYQGVTLGGTGKQKGKRHPTLRNGVFVGNNANILGDITIGENSRVGAGSVVLRDVPPESTVVGVPAHIVYQQGKRVLITDPREVSDPLSDVIVSQGEEIAKLRQRLERLDGQFQAAMEETISPLAAEVREREEYREQQQERQDLFSMGEAI